MTQKYRRLAMFAAAVGSLTAATAHGAIGARVLVQEWTPFTPDRQDVKVLVDRPTLLTDSLNSTWASARVNLCKAISNELGKGRAAAGQTLRDINCNLDPNLTLALRQTGPNSIVATLALDDNSITATSTQPTACGSECDPRVSVSARAAVTLGISIQNDPARPLLITSATFGFSNASIDSHNFAADVAKFVVDDLIPFFNGPNFLTIAQNAINNVQFRFADQFNNALGPVNAQLVGPSQYVRVGLWARATRITIAFAPREILPPGNGSMTGVVHWDASKGAPPNGCAAVNLVSTVQTGPAPMLDPDSGAVGDAPTRKIGTYGARAAGDGQCNYTLNGIAAGWPNTVSATVAHGGGGGGPVKMSFAIKPDGWGGAVVPQPTVGAHNYLVYESFGGSLSEVDPRRKVLSPGDPPGLSANVDPRANPADFRTQPAVVTATPAAAVNAAIVAAPTASTSIQQRSIGTLVKPAVLATPAATAPAAASSTLSRSIQNGAVLKTPAAPVAPASSMGR